MIRTADEHDIKEVARIYSDIIAYEEQHTKYTAFQEEIYPTETTAQKALTMGSLYVCEMDGKICGSIILNQNQPKEYENIAWKYSASQEEVMVIHLLCVHPSKTGQGLGKDLITFAAREAERQGCLVLRLDTGEQNKPAIHLYEELGFIKAGEGNMRIGGCIPHNDHLFYEKSIGGKLHG